MQYTAFSALCKVTDDELQVIATSHSKKRQAYDRTAEVTICLKQ